MSTVTLHRSFDVEVPTPSRREHGVGTYRWTTGWMQRLPGGGMTQTLPLRAWFALGKRDGFTVKLSKER